MNVSIDLVERSKVMLINNKAELIKSKELLMNLEIQFKWDKEHVEEQPSLSNLRLECWKLLIEFLKKTITEYEATEAPHERTPK